MHHFSQLLEGKPKQAKAKRADSQAGSKRENTHCALEAFGKEEVNGPLLCAGTHPVIKM